MMHHNLIVLALEEDVIDQEKVSEDYSKVMTTDFVMSMSRKVEDKIGKHRSIPCN